MSSLLEKIAIDAEWYDHFAKPGRRRPVKWYYHSPG